MLACKPASRLLPIMRGKNRPERSPSPATVAPLTDLRTDLLTYRRDVRAVAGGSINHNRLEAINRFDLDCYSNGMRSPSGSGHRIQYFCLRGPDTLAGANIAYYSNYSRNLTFVNFVSGDYNPLTGLQGGNGKYYRSNWIPPEGFFSNGAPAFLAIWIEGSRANTAGAGYCNNGINTFGVNKWELGYSSGGGGDGWFHIHADTSYYTSLGTSLTGLQLANRQTTTLVRAISNSTLVGFNSSASTGAIEAPLFFFACNDNAQNSPFLNPVGYTTNRHFFEAGGVNLTSNALETTFMTIAANLVTRLKVA